ncbi:MAG: hypothetical protein CL596_00260 [Alteromonas sp.]|nr:hypothetical protein [Alteromonas sp.]MAY23162.1 hypothetical protein [Flavobacteriaceae bacterium]|tara:strand:- start:126608 stop:127012 length:405 start_codon:yes stop_codon:yes gene_type:complete
MTPSENTQLSFYQKAGELFYTVAAADGVVRKKEFQALKKMVKEEWKDLDDFEDEFGVDAAHQLEIVFDWLDYESLDAEECFESFEDFYKEHPTLFSKKRKDLILKTAHAIAHAFAGKNKSELIVLGKLQLLFNR